MFRNHHRCLVPELFPHPKWKPHALQVVAPPRPVPPALATPTLRSVSADVPVRGVS